MKLLQRVGEPPKGLDGWGWWLALAGYRLATIRQPSGYLSVTAKATKTRKAGAKRVHSGPFFMLVCKVDPQKTVPVGLKEDGAHCWIRTNDPIGVNDVLYH